MKITYLTHYPYRHLPSDFRSRYGESVVTNPYFELVDPKLMQADLRASLDESMHAARAGFDGVGMTEHGGSSYDVSPNPDLQAAALAYATEMEGLETAIFAVGRSLGKSREPMRVAEELAWIDTLSGGRLVCGLPVGLPYDANVNAGVAPIETRARYDENFELVLRAWTDPNPFPFNGRYSQYSAVNIWPRPVQSPHPPVSITGIGNPNTTRFALERDLGFNVVALAGHPKKAAQPIFDHLWRLADELGVDDNPYRATFVLFVAVAETDELAEQLYGEHVEYHLGRGIGAIPMNRVALPGGISPQGLRAMLGSRNGAAAPSGPPTFRQAVEHGAVVAGSPATVVDQITEYVRDLRVGNLLVHLQMGSMPHELTKYNIDMFASNVMPALKPLWSEYDDTNRWWPERLGGNPVSAKQAEPTGARLQ